MKVWDASGRVASLHELKGHTVGVMSVAFSPDGTRIVSGSGDKTAKVWDARDWHVAARTQGAHEAGDERGVQPGRHADRLRRGHDGEGVGRADGDDPARSQGAHGRCEERGVQPGRQRGSSPAVRTRRRRCGMRGRARPCSSSKGTRVRCASVAFSPDGTRIVSGSEDKSAKVWDARTGTSLLELKGHTFGVMSVAYSPDGSRIVSGSVDSTAKVWDARTGAPCSR